MFYSSTTDPCHGMGCREGILGEASAQAELERSQGQQTGNRNKNGSPTFGVGTGRMKEAEMVEGAQEGDTQGLDFALHDNEPESLDVGWLFDDIFGPSGPSVHTDLLNGIFDTSDYHEHDLDGFRII